MIGHVCSSLLIGMGGIATGMEVSQTAPEVSRFQGKDRERQYKDPDHLVPTVRTDSNPSD